MKEAMLRDFTLLEMTGLIPDANYHLNSDEISIDIPLSLRKMGDHEIK